MSLANDTGSNTSDKITSDGTLNVSGETGATFEYSTTSTNGTNGSWGSANPLNSNEGSKSVWVRQIDKAGNVSTGTQFTFTLDKTASVSIDSVTDNYPSGSASVGNNGWTNDQTLALSGSVEAGSTVKVYGGADGSSFLGDATVTGGGWTFNTTTLIEGKHTLKVVATDKAGNTASDTHVVNVDVTAPSLSYTINDNVGNITGELTNNSTTDDRKPTFSGTAEASKTGANVTVYLMEGSTELGSAIVGTDGSWSITPTGNLSNNIHNLTVKVVDAAGNTTSSNVTLDVNDGPHNRQATITSGGNDDVGLYTGAINDGAVSDDRDIVLSGTVANAQAGDWVRVYDGNNYVGMSTIGAGGSFSVAASNLSSGDHNFQAFVVNKYGVESNNAGNNFDYNVDVSAPNNTVVLSSVTVSNGTVYVYGDVNGNGYDRYFGGGGPILDGNNNGTVTLALFDGDTLVGSGTYNFGAGNGEGVDPWVWGPWTNLSNGVHNLSVRAIDAAGNLGAKSNVLTADVVKNEAPTDITLSKTSVAENSAEGVVVGQLDFTDAGDNSTHVYSIVGGTGQGKFVIDSATGELKVAANAGLNYESGTTSYTLTLRVTDQNGTGLSHDKEFTISITDVNDVAPEIDSGASAANYVEGTSVTVYTATRVDNDGTNANKAVTWSLKDGLIDDRALFTIDATSGAVTFVASPDFDSAAALAKNNTYTFTVVATNVGAGGSLSDEQLVTVHVTDVNDNKPVFVSDDSFSFAENDTGVVFQAETHDNDGTEANRAVVYTLEGADAGLFHIDTDGNVTFASAPDYDIPGDADGNNQYKLTVVATNGAQVERQDVTVELTKVNDNAPVIDGNANRTFQIDENDAAPLSQIFTFSAQDGDSTPPDNTITWSLEGADKSLFTITNGKLVLNSQANYEAKSQYKVTVVATDGGTPSLSDTVSVTINVKDINERPTADASVEVSYSENVLGFGAFGQVIADIHPQDPDKQSGVAGAAADLLNNFENLTYTITSGNESGLFMVSGGKVYLNPLKSLDFEKQPVHTLTIVTRDGGGLETSSTVKINVDDVDEAPVFTDGFLNFIKSISVNEGDVDVPMPAVVAVDPDAGDAAVVYSIVTGVLSPDASKFTIDPATGALKLVNPADYEAKQVFTVQIKATDGNNPSLYAIQQIIVTVADKNEAPTTADQAFSVTENLVDGGLVGKVIGTDPDKQTGAAAVLDLLNNFENLTYAFAEGGNAGGLFTIDATTGDIRLAGALDAETKTQYELKVVTTDGAGASKESTVTVTVEDVNDKAPVITSEATAAPFVEHGTGQVYKVTSTDDDLTEGNRAVTYTLEGGDSTLFNINAETGVVTFKDAPDFENPGGLAGNNTYSFTVKATNTGGGVTLTDSKTVSVTVTDANDKAPVITSAAVATPFAERGTGVVYTVTSTDADGTPDNRVVTYAIEGDDAHLFNIDAETGVVTFKDAPDFDAPLDVGGDNAYNFTVKAINTAGGVTLTDSKAVTVNVVDVNEFAPVFTSGTTADAFAENGTGVVYTAVTTDDDTYQSTSYALAGDDANLFNIDATTGEVTFKVAPDFENPADVNANNIYNFIVIATNATAGGTQTASQSVVLTVTDVNEAAPVFTSANAVTVAEGNGGVIYTATTTDTDSTKIVSYSLTGVDAGLFTINAATGAVSFRNAPNFEAPADAGANNVYNFEIVATNTTSGVTQTSTQAMTVTVTDIDETNLVITSPGGPINDSTPRVVGGANATLAGQTVTLFEGARELGTATVQADGSWSMDAANLGNDGIHNLIARLGGQSSNVVAFNLDTVAPTVAITGVTGPGLTATVAGTAGASEVGRAVVILEGSTVLGTGVVAADGTFSFSVTMPASGPHNLVASVTDAAGNDGVSTPVTYNAAPTPNQGQADADNIVTAYQNIMDRPSIATKDTAFMLDLAEKMGSGAMSYQQALAKVIDLADGTTSVATLSYQFFTGKVPTKAGLDYLILEPGTNPNNLNSAYYQNFNVENRYINFAVNLGHDGEGKTAFQTNYGSLSLFDATKKAYAEIFGSVAATDTKIHAILDEMVNINGQNGARSAYFAAYGHDDLGTKAAMVGWLLAEAAKADVGTYALSNEAFLADLSDGAAYNVNIIGVYGTSSMALV